VLFRSQVKNGSFGRRIALRGVFTLLFIHPESVNRLASALKSVRYSRLYTHIRLTLKISDFENSELIVNAILLKFLIGLLIWYLIDIESLN
jgi:hypothetical protein